MPRRQSLGATLALTAQRIDKVRARVHAAAIEAHDVVETVQGLRDKIYLQVYAMEDAQA